MSLEVIEHALPWICLRDRDLLTEADRNDLIAAHPNLHIWNGRMLENELLDPDLIVETFKRAGKVVERDLVVETMRETANSLKGN
ncbi:hypothetical protein GCM10010178_62030 [Lentzea flava]|uniref:Uncharacterized protein n=1 Tax=Lentzea flava TaxID=103732 RepID=A0ABQ2V1Z5_9PSEU|nr:hypothetical protein GCM10010178_62030 [Lentzea flava]